MNPVPTSPKPQKRDIGGSLKHRVASFSDHLRLEREARELRRERLRAEQRDHSSTPEARICAWEQLHGLQLPTDPVHPVLFAVANGTRLSVLQVRDEQSSRAARRAVPSRAE